jgi:hypothetical protein
MKLVIVCAIYSVGLITGFLVSRVCNNSCKCKKSADCCGSGCC